MPEDYTYKPEEQRKGAGTTVRAWRIYYGDFTTFDNKRGTWDDAPAENVQIVILFEGWDDDLGRPRRFMMSGDDYYYSDGTWFGSSFTDIAKAFGTVKFGKFISDADFNRILQTAEADYNL